MRFKIYLKIHEKVNWIKNKKCKIKKKSIKSHERDRFSFVFLSALNR